MEQKDLKLSGYRQLEQLRQEYESLPVPRKPETGFLPESRREKKKQTKLK